MTRRALMDAVRAEVERQIVLGSSLLNPLEFSGYLAEDFPRQTISVGTDILASLDEAVDAVSAGGGIAKADALFCHQRTRRFIARAMRASGFAPPFVWVERLGRNALAVPTTQGPVPVICSNWFPVDPKTQKTSVIAVHLYSDRGVHLAVPEQSPTMRLSKVRATNRPEEFSLVEWKGALTTIDGGRIVQLCDVGPV